MMALDGLAGSLFLGNRMAKVHDPKTAARRAVKSPLNTP
jgi:hypothetical protein